MSERPTDQAIRDSTYRDELDGAFQKGQIISTVYNDVVNRDEELKARIAAKDRRIAELEASKSGVPHKAVCLFQDGNAWCAVYGDFTNLQKSPAGFGDTYSEAITALQKESKKRQWWPDEESK